MVMPISELRQLAHDTVDQLSDQECAELLEWAKNEFPELGKIRRYVSWAQKFQLFFRAWQS